MGAGAVVLAAAALLVELRRLTVTRHIVRSPPVTPVGSGRCVAGWYRDAPAPLYVSRGIGETMIPMRFSCPPGIAVFDWALGEQGA